jgi:hypothetical protein
MEVKIKNVLLNMELGRLQSHQKMGVIPLTAAQSSPEYVTLKQALENYTGQKGILVFLDGEAAGFDMVSRDSAYKDLHSKLVKSYAMEAVLLKNGKELKNGMKKAEDFIKQVTTCKGKKYASAGSGWDHRFEGDEIVGSALVYGKNVIHAAFFKMTEEEKAGSMSSLARRKKFRTG